MGGGRQVTFCALKPPPQPGAPRPRRVSAALILKVGPVLVLTA